jgi:hypothetical protein
VAVHRSAPRKKIHVKKGGKEMKRLFVFVLMVSLLGFGCDDDASNTNNVNNVNNVNNANNINNTNNINNANNINNTNNHPGYVVADHAVVGQFEDIPGTALTAAIEDLNVYYGHTSHGSQLVTGMEMLQARADFASLNLTEEYGDLGHLGDLESRRIWTR